jgi:Ca2+-binding RTX toxin-like protein
MTPTTLPGFRRNLKTATAGVVLATGLAVSVLAVTAVEAAAKPTCGGRKATIVRGAGDDVISVPKKGVQVIVAGAGNDTIIAKRNRDIVCGGDGNDHIAGGTGRDRLFGGTGNDSIDEGPGSGTVASGDGDDTVIGGPGGDAIAGGAGTDRLFGEIQDDRISGEGGQDLVVGGQGVDQLDGGDEADWIRGDTAEDTYNGGPGTDTLSFATATPPGPETGLDGVSVSLPSSLAADEDGRERTSGVENLVGSPFADKLTGTGGVVRGGGGPDACAGFAVTACGPGSQAGGGPVAYLTDLDGPDPGLVLFGGAGDDSWTVTGGGSLRVTGSALAAGPGCQPTSGGGVSCTAPAAGLGYVLLWGGSGNDSLSVGSAFSPGTLIKIDGGPGNDRLDGGPGADTLWAGESGSDQLFGNGGDDSLMGRPGGGDLLAAGPGSDQLVSDDPCAGHHYDGGPGLADVAGFAYVIRGGVIARLGGRATIRGDRGCNPTRVLRSNEILEGTIRSDVLIGDNRPNLIIGREGDDLLIGKGGHDELRGDAGNDRCRPGARGALKLSC